MNSQTAPDIRSVVSTFLARAMLIVLSITLVSGCARMTHLTRDRDLADQSKTEALIVDAKQRAVITSRLNDDSLARICAEPSPDALSALAASSGFTLSRKDSIDLANSLALSEGAGSIGLRTQSIQLMRDSMYRICEGYLSGALNDISFETLHRRFQSSMVAILAIEQITGVVRAPAVSIGGSAVLGSAELVAKYTEKTELARGKVNQAKESEAGTKKKLDEAGEATKKHKGDKTKKEAELKTQNQALSSTNTAITKAQGEITELDKQIATAQEANDTDKVKLLTDQKSAKEKEVTALTNQVGETNTAITKTTEEIAALDKKIEESAKSEADAKTKHETQVADRKAREEELDAYDKARKSAVNGSLNAQTTVNVSDENCCHKLDKETAEAIAGKVVTIVEKTLELGFSRELCTTLLGRAISTTSSIATDSILGKCLRYLNETAELVASYSNINYQLGIQMASVSGLLADIAASTDTYSPELVTAIAALVAAKNTAGEGQEIDLGNILFNMPEPQPVD